MRSLGRAARSVRGRITILATALVAVTLVFASWLLIRLVQADLLASVEQTLDQALESQAEQLAGSSELLEVDETFELIAADIDGNEIEIGLFTEAEDGLAFGELYVDGELAAGLKIDPQTGEIEDVLDVTFDGPLSDPDLRDQLESLVFEVFALSDSDGGRFLVGATPLDEIEESVAAIRQALLVIVPSLIAVFGLSTWWLVGRALRPVMSITEQVEAISTSNLHQRVPVPETGDEVAELATVMNNMLTRLERGGERQRRFSADASHELRSPLSTVRAAAELLGRDPPRERVDGLAADIVAEADRMEQLIAGLLELSRLDEDRRATLMEEVDLVELIRVELDGEAVELVTPPRLSMTGSPDQLRRLVRNLVDNANRHATGRVEVSLAADDDRSLLAVEDDGSGIPESQRQVIFERFSRLDEARSRDDGGSGLGLALVKTIVENHGGSVAATDSHLGGARLAVTLPHRQRR